MLVEVCRSKIHRATITDADLHYEGSLTLDSQLMEAADLKPYQKVQLLNLNNGLRAETYVIRGKKGSGTVCLNGAAARWGHKGDMIIIIAYALVPENELKGSYRPRVVHVDAKNHIVRVVGG